MSSNLQHALIICAGVLILLTVDSTIAQTANSIEVVVASGPQAGTYKLPASNIVRMNVKTRKRFSAAYKDPKAQEAKTISGVGINMEPNRAGP